MTPSTAILTLLQDGKHREYRQIAKEIKQPKTTVFDTIKRLIRKGKVARVKVLATGRVTYYLVQK